ncbi:hypothetical protein ABPG75_006058 [Micractinium tetrahymenae]
MAGLVESNTGTGAGSTREQQLLDVLGRFDDAYFNQDAEGLKALLADDVFFQNYKYKHFPVVRAVNEKTNSAYCLWDDEDVIMKPEQFDEALPASGNITSVSGIWRLIVEQQQKVKHIWFLRQLTREEKKHRLKHRPSQLYCDFHAKSLVGPTLDLSEKQIKKMHAAAEAFNEAWRSGDCGPVHAVLSPSAHSVSPIFGEKKASREEWEEMVHDVFKVWEVKSNEVDIAVTPSSNKAFIFWHVRGVQKDTKQDNDMYGLNLLVFDVKEGLISEVVGFRQPLRSEHDHIFKAGSYLEMKERDAALKQAEAPGGLKDQDTQTEGEAAV